MVTAEIYREVGPTGVGNIFDEAEIRGGVSLRGRAGAGGESLVCNERKIHVVRGLPKLVTLGGVVRVAPGAMRGVKVARDHYRVGAGEANGFLEQAFEPLLVVTGAAVYIEYVHALSGCVAREKLYHDMFDCGHVEVVHKAGDLISDQRGGTAPSRRAG